MLDLQFSCMFGLCFCCIYTILTSRGHQRVVFQALPNSESFLNNWFIWFKVSKGYISPITISPQYREWFVQTWMLWISASFRLASALSCSPLSRWSRARARWYELMVPRSGDSSSRARVRWDIWTDTIQHELLTYTFKCASFLLFAVLCRNSKLKAHLLSTFWI